MRFPKGFGGRCIETVRGNTPIADRYQHLFDGDGPATHIAFDENGTYYTSRFVRSEESLTRKKETTITVHNMQESSGFQVPFQAVVPYSGIVHDFAFTENTLVFVVPPVKLPQIPLVM